MKIKKVLIVIAILTLILSLSIALAACNDPGQGGGDDGGNSEAEIPETETPTIAPAPPTFTSSVENGVFSWTSNYKPKKVDIKINGAYYDALALAAGSGKASAAADTGVNGEYKGSVNLKEKIDGLYDGEYSVKVEAKLLNSSVTESTQTLIGAIDKEAAVPVEFIVGDEVVKTLYLAEGTRIDESYLPKVAENDGFNYTKPTIAAPIEVKKDADLKETLKIQAVAEQYALKAELNGGTAEPPIASEYTAEQLPLPLPTPVKDGYLFGGWYKNAQFTGEQVAEIDRSMLGGVSVFAKWTERKGDAEILMDAIENTLALRIFAIRAENLRIEAEYADGVLKKSLFTENGAPVTGYENGYLYDYKNKVYYPVSEAEAESAGASLEYMIFDNVVSFTKTTSGGVDRFDCVLTNGMEISYVIKGGYVTSATAYGDTFNIERKDAITLPSSDGLTKLDIIKITLVCDCGEHDKDAEHGKPENQNMVIDGLHTGDLIGDRLEQFPHRGRVDGYYLDAEFIQRVDIEKPLTAGATWYVKTISEQEYYSKYTLNLTLTGALNRRVGINAYDFYSTHGKLPSGLIPYRGHSKEAGLYDNGMVYRFGELRISYPPHPDGTTRPDDVSEVPLFDLIQKLFNESTPVNNAFNVSVKVLPGESVQTVKMTIDCDCDVCKGSRYVYVPAGDPIEFLAYNVYHEAKNGFLDNGVYYSEPECGAASEIRFESAMDRDMTVYKKITPAYWVNFECAEDPEANVSHKIPYGEDEENSLISAYNREKPDTLWKDGKALIWYSDKAMTTPAPYNDDATQTSLSIKITKRGNATYYGKYVDAADAVLIMKAKGGREYRRYDFKAVSGIPLSVSLLINRAPEKGGDSEYYDFYTLADHIYIDLAGSETYASYKYVYTDAEFETPAGLPIAGVTEYYSPVMDRIKADVYYEGKLTRTAGFQLINRRYCLYDIENKLFYDEAFTRPYKDTDTVLEDITLYANAIDWDAGWMYDGTLPEDYVAVTVEFANSDDENTYAYTARTQLGGRVVLGVDNWEGLTEKFDGYYLDRECTRLLSDDVRYALTDVKEDITVYVKLKFKKQIMIMYYLDGEPYEFNYLWQEQSTVFAGESGTIELPDRFADFEFVKMYFVLRDGNKEPYDTREYENMPMEIDRIDVVLIPNPESLTVSLCLTTTVYGGKYWKDVIVNRGETLALKPYTAAEIASFGEEAAFLTGLNFVYIDLSNRFGQLINVAEIDIGWNELMNSYVHCFFDDKANKYVVSFSAYIIYGNAAQA